MPNPHTHPFGSQFPFFAFPSSFASTTSPSFYSSAFPWSVFPNKINDLTMNMWKASQQSPESWNEALELSKAHLQKTLETMKNSLEGSGQSHGRLWGFSENYQNLMKDYLVFLDTLYTSAFELFTETLSPAQKQRKILETAQEVGKFWIECCEKIYDLRMQTPEYQKLYGDMIRAWCQWKFREPGSQGF